MNAIEWNSDFNTGILEIDEHHKRILFYIKQLEQISHTENMIDVRSVFNSLADYTLTHFEFEEKLQERAGYPFLKAHKKVHDVFRNRIATFSERLDNGENIVPDLIFMLKTWAANHIKGDDRDIVDSVKKMLGFEREKNKGWMSAKVRRILGPVVPSP